MALRAKAAGMRLDCAWPEAPNSSPANRIPRQPTAIALRKLNRVRILRLSILSRRIRPSALPKFLQPRLFHNFNLGWMLSQCQARDIAITARFTRTGATLLRLLDAYWSFRARRQSSKAFCKYESDLRLKVSTSGAHERRTAQEKRVPPSERSATPRSLVVHRPRAWRCEDRVRVTGDSMVCRSILATGSSRRVTLRLPSGR